jgi:hypothetical protein
MRPVAPASPAIPEHLRPLVKQTESFVPEIDFDDPFLEIDENDEKILRFVEAVCNDDDPARRAYLMDCARNLRMYRGLHWFNDAFSGRLTTASNGFAFRYLNRADFGSDSPLPLPTTNFIGVQVDNETARLGRKEYQPSSSAGGSAAELQEAAAFTQDVLEWDMKDLSWSEARTNIELDFTLFGMAVAKSWIDQIQTDGSVQALADAHMCASCGAKYASRMDDSGGMIGSCLGCGEDALERTEIPEGVSNSEMDMLGRPLAQLVSKMRARVDHVPLQDMFFQNGGVKVQPASCSIWGQASVVELDWIADRWPDQADKIHAEPPEDLVKYDLFMGDFVRMMGGSVKSVYPCHARLREVHVLPRRGLRRGVSFYVVNGIVLEARALMHEWDGKTIPMVKYGVARQKRIPGVIYGRSAVSDCVPLNRRYNELDFMQEETTMRGYPVIVHPPGVTFSQSRQGSFTVVEVQTPDDSTQNLKDLMMPTPAQTGGEYTQKMENLVAKMREIMGPAPIESTGAAVRGTQTATGLQIEVEQREQARSPRERELKDGIYTPLWAHHVGLLAAFETDGEAVIEESSTVFRTESYKSADLATGVDVKLESKGNFDRTLFQREGVQQGLQLGFYDLSDPAAKEKAREAMGLPEIATAKSDQLRIAEEAWQAWIEVASQWAEGSEMETEGAEPEGDLDEPAQTDQMGAPVAPVPVFDTITNDPGTWFAVLGKAWLGDKARRVRSVAQWDAFLRMISGWPDKLAQAEMVDAQQRQIYGGVPPEGWPQHFQLLQQKSQEMAKEQAQQAAMGGQPAPPPQQQGIIPPPQSGMFLPDPMEERIQAVWGQMVGGQIPASVARLLGMYSLICACWVRMKKSAEAQGMMAQPAAPGSVGGQPA